MQKFLTTLARIGVVTIIVATLFTAGLVGYARSQGQLILSVQTGSMRPAVRPGDAVLVRQQSGSQAGNFRVGDIVSYHSLKNPDVIITHRLIDIDRQRGLLTTKGDALDVADPAFSPDHVVGVVSRVVPLAGYGFNFVRHPAGLITAVYLPSALLVLWEIRRLMRYYAQQHYELYYY